MDINVKLLPFHTPNFVQIDPPARPRQEGPRFGDDGYAISELDAGTLSGLCDEFRASVFLKARKQDPNPPKPWSYAALN